MFKNLNLFAIALVALSFANCNGIGQMGLGSTTQNEAQEEMKEKSIMDVLLDKEIKKLVEEQFVVLQDQSFVNHKKVNDIQYTINFLHQNIRLVLKKLGYSPTLLLSKKYIQQKLEETWNKIVVKDLKKYQEAILVNNITIDDFCNQNYLLGKYLPEPTTIDEKIKNCFVVSAIMNDITNDFNKDSIDNLMEDNEFSDADKNLLTYFAWIYIAHNWMSSIYGIENQHLPIKLPKSVPPHLQ